MSRLTSSLGLAQVAYDEMDVFVARRRGLFHWRVVCISGADGVEREAAGGARFWRQLTAHRVALGLRTTMLSALWQAGAHPMQHGRIAVVAIGGALGPGGATPAASA